MPLNSSNKREKASHSFLRVEKCLSSKKDHRSTTFSQPLTNVWSLGDWDASVALVPLEVASDRAYSCVRGGFAPSVDSSPSNLPIPTFAKYTQSKALSQPTCSGLRTLSESSILNRGRFLQSRSPTEKAAASNPSSLCVVEGCVVPMATEVSRVQMVGSRVS